MHAAGCLILARAVLAGSAAGPVEIKVFTRLGAALVCLAFMGTRLPWVLDENTAPAEKPLGLAAVHSKSG